MGETQINAPLSHILCYNDTMKNKHLEHPEDSILNKGREGALEVLKYLKSKKSELSVKYDGAPAIVWGRNPENGKFFVGTKSVFNKVKVKINYTHHDIEVNHGHIPRVASILHLCFEKLPRYDGIFQGDFIGYGGTDTFDPNTITYKFDKDIKQDIVVAAHTRYIGRQMKNLEAVFHYNTAWSEEVKFLDATATIKSRSRKLDLLLSLAQTACRFVRFPDPKEGERIKVIVNSFIREQKELNPEALAAATGFGKNLFYLYNFIIEIKELLMEGITSKENIECFIDAVKCEHEGYVMTNDFGTYKSVNRKQFSYANFNIRKEWKKEMSLK